MAEWAGLGYYARARNLLKGARAVVAEHGGRFPATREGLLTLPGVGPYTAAAVASIAFDAPEVVVDGNVERVIARLFRVETPLPLAKPELTALAARLTPAQRPGDYAQAVMDLGATICTPRSPACGICPWRDPCIARAEGVQAELPRKLPKAAKPVRRGILYLARRADGAKATTLFPLWRHERAGSDAARRWSVLKGLIAYDRTATTRQVRFLWLGRVRLAPANGKTEEPK